MAIEEKALLMPKKIEPGDTLGVIAPSMPVKPGEKEKLTAYLEASGYRVKLGKTVKELSNFHGYLAGDPKDRAEDVNQMFADPEVDGIICARGGYGSSGVMDYLDLDMIRQHPKVFIGYSDITNFHSVFSRYCGFVTFHGPMVISNMLKGFDDYSRDSLERALAMEDHYVFRNPEGDPMHILMTGRATGVVTGGNISLIAHSVGTFYQPVTEGRILFLEDVDESIAHLDMMITQMEQAGVMKGVRGVLLGNFADCSNDSYDSSYRIDQFLRDRFAAYQVPVMSNVCSGHARPMGTIPMGTVCTMDTDSDEIIFSC